MPILFRADLVFSAKKSEDLKLQSEYLEKTNQNLKIEQLQLKQKIKS
jgi:hypothetical protein